MRCYRARRWLSAYLDGELDRRRRAVLEDHLGRCSRCAAELNRFKEHWAALASVDPVPPIPPDLRNHVVQALDEANRRPWYRLHRVQLLRAACVTACVVLGLAGGALFSWRGPAAINVRQKVPVSERLLVAEAFDATAFGLGERKEGLFRCVPR